MSPRSNFDTLKESYTVVLQVTIGEDFLEVMIDTMRAVGRSGFIYFITLILFGRYILGQMFLAIILGKFEDARNRINYAHLATKAFIAKIANKKKLAHSQAALKARGMK